jgi:6-phosphogluconate dehydrogenase
MAEQGYQIGMVGLGVMGRNLLLNMADHGFSGMGYDTDQSKVQLLRHEAGERRIEGAASLPEFMGGLSSPRAIMMLVPAGPPVDAVIRALMPHLEPGDLLIDGGNSYFKDTELRAATLAERGVQFLGVGISGGENGARHGASLMPGGAREAYERVRPILEAVAARVPVVPSGLAVAAASTAAEAGLSPNGAAHDEAELCVAYMGPGGAGHYVKMVHNGIEYALMELIAESYDIMSRALGLTDEELEAVYRRWNEGELNSYLIEITANIFGKVDERTGKRLVDVILDQAGQKGTGKWTSQSAMDLGVPAPTVDAAVSMRDLSALKDEREQAAQILHGPQRTYRGERPQVLHQLHNALYVGMASAYAQGLALLRVASQSFHYDLKLEEVARIWRGGCIIRSAMLEPIRAAYSAQPDLPNLLLDQQLGWEVMARQPDLRAIIRSTVGLGISIPGLSAALAYFDGYRSAWLPANLIQAQRDYFGAHTYERIDEKGVFHTHWSED